MARPKIDLHVWLNLIEKIEAIYPGKIKSISNRDGVTVEQLCQDALRVSVVAESVHETVELLLTEDKAGLDGFLCKRLLL